MEELSYSALLKQAKEKFGEEHSDVRLARYVTEQIPPKKSTDLNLLLTIYETTYKVIEYRLSKPVIEATDAELNAQLEIMEKERIPA